MSEPIHSLTVLVALQIPFTKDLVSILAWSDDKWILAAEYNAEEVAFLDLLLWSVVSARRVVDYLSETTSSCCHDPSPRDNTPPSTV